MNYFHILCVVLNYFAFDMNYLHILCSVKCTKNSVIQLTRFQIEIFII